MSHPALSGSFANRIRQSMLGKLLFKLSHPALSGSFANRLRRNQQCRSLNRCHTLLFRVLLQTFLKYTTIHRNQSCHTLLFRVLLQTAPSGWTCWIRLSSCHTLLFRVLLQTQQQPSTTARSMSVVTPCSFGFFCKLYFLINIQKLRLWSCHTLLFRVLLQTLQGISYSAAGYRVVTPCSFGFFCKLEETVSGAPNEVIKLSHPALSGSFANWTPTPTPAQRYLSCHTLLFRVLLQTICRRNLLRALDSCHTLLFRVLLQTRRKKLWNTPSLLKLSHPALSGSFANKKEEALEHAQLAQVVTPCSFGFFCKQ